MVSRARQLSLSLYSGDVLISLISLYLADLLRHVLPFGFGNPISLAWIDWPEYLAVAIIWAFMLRFFRVYDPSRILTVVEEVRVLLPAITIAFIFLFSYCLYSFKLNQ